MQKHFLSSQTVPLQIMSSEKHSVAWSPVVELDAGTMDLSAEKGSPHYSYVPWAFKMDDSSLCVNICLSD